MRKQNDKEKQRVKSKGLLKTLTVYAVCTILCTISASKDLIEKFSTLAGIKSAIIDISRLLLTLAASSAIVDNSRLLLTLAASSAIVYNSRLLSTIADYQL